MIRISTKEIVDILPYGDGKAIVVEKNPLSTQEKRFKATYSVVDFEKKTKEVLTKNAYLLRKFGTAFKAISETIPNFVQCGAAILYDKRVLVIYPNGEAGIFDREGDLSWSGYFRYHNQIVCGLALEGKYFWTICPAEGCAIRYSCQTMQVDLRIGGKEAPTFVNPTHISADGENIYVCSHNKKVRKIEGANFTVSDYLRFDENVSAYYKFGKYSIAVLESGTYLFDDK